VEYVLLITLKLNNLFLYRWLEVFKANNAGVWILARAVESGHFIGHDLSSHTFVCLASLWYVISSSVAIELLKQEPLNQNVCREEQNCKDPLND
jgi:hypothetical protein